MKAEAQLGSSSESKVVLETTRTTSQTMRMEHKTNFPDLAVTFSQRTQTPTIPLVSEGTAMEPQEVKKQTEATQTQPEPAFKPESVFKPEPVFKPESVSKPAQFAPSIPFPFDTTDSAPVSAAPEPLKTSALQFFESNLKNLPPLQDDKYTRYEDMVKSSKTYVHKQNEVKEQFTTKLHDDLSYLNLVPEPPPEMGFMPKVQKPQPERIVEKVKKLEEIHQSSETPLSGTVFPQSFKKEEKYEKKEFLSTISTSPFVQKPASPLPTYTPQINRDQLFTADPMFARSTSPKPSSEAVNMEKLWALKPKSPEPYSLQQQQQMQQQSFSHEHKSSFVAYSSQQTNVYQPQQQEVVPPKEHFVPVQPYPVEQQPQEELPKMSIKDTKSYFEQRIKQEEVKTHPSDLKAPGLVRQFAKPMVPLIPLDMEPGSPPEMCYAPKPVLERKQSYVEKIEKTLEQNIENEPERVPRGGVRILPQRQTPQRSVASPSPHFQTAPSPKPAAPPVVEHIIKPIILQEPAKIIAEPFVPLLPQFEKYETKEFRSENYEIKKESFTSENLSGYRHVAPPTFLQNQAKPAELAPLPPTKFEAPKAPEPFIRKPEPAVPKFAPPPMQFSPPPMMFEAPKVNEPLIKKPEPVQQQPIAREVPIAIQKPALQQHKPVSPMQPKPFVKAKPKFNEFISESHESHSLYKNFVKSEESSHTSESYFQKVEPKVLSPLQQQFKQPEPPRQQFVPPPQQVRKKHFPDVML